MKKLIALMLMLSALLCLAACSDTNTESTQSSVITEAVDNGSTSKSDTTSENDSNGTQQSEATESSTDTKEAVTSSNEDNTEIKPDRQQLLAEENARHQAVIASLESQKSSTADYYDRQIFPLEGYNTEEHVAQYTDKKQMLESKKATLKEEIAKYQASTRPEDAAAAAMLTDDLADIEKQLKQLEILLEPYEQIIKLKNEKAEKLGELDLKIQEENELYQSNLNSIFK